MFNNYDMNYSMNYVTRIINSLIIVIACSLLSSKIHALTDSQIQQRELQRIFELRINNESQYLRAESLKYAPTNIAADSQAEIHKRLLIDKLQQQQAKTEFLSIEPSPRQVDELQLTRKLTRNLKQYYESSLVASYKLQDAALNKFSQIIDNFIYKSRSIHSSIIYLPNRIMTMAQLAKRNFNQNIKLYDIFSMAEVFNFGNKQVPESKVVAKKGMPESKVTSELKTLDEIFNISKLFDDVKIRNNRLMTSIQSVAVLGKKYSNQVIGNDKQQLNTVYDIAKLIETVKLKNDKLLNANSSNTKEIKVINVKNRYNKKDLKEQSFAVAKLIKEVKLKNDKILSLIAQQSYKFNKSDKSPKSNKEQKSLSLAKFNKSRLAKESSIVVTMAKNRASSEKDVFDLGSKKIDGRPKLRIANKIKENVEPIASKDSLKMLISNSGQNLTGKEIINKLVNIAYNGDNLSDVISIKDLKANSSTVEHAFDNNIPKILSSYKKSEIHSAANMTSGNVSTVKQTVASEPVSKNKTLNTENKNSIYFNNKEKNNFTGFKEKSAAHKGITPVDQITPADKEPKSVVDADLDKLSQLKLDNTNNIKLITQNPSGSIIITESKPKSDKKTSSVVKAEVSSRDQGDDNLISKHDIDAGKKVEDEPLVSKKLVAVPHTNAVINEYKTAVNMYRLGFYDKAVEQLKQIIDVYPKYVKAYELLYDITMAQNDISTAEQYLEKALPNNSANITLNLLLAKVKIRQNKNEQALKLLEGFTPHVKEQPEFYATVALAHSNMGSFMKAADIYTTLIKYDSDNGNYWFGLAFNVDKAGNYNTAKEIYMKGLTKNSMRPELSHYARTRISGAGD